MSRFLVTGGTGFAGSHLVEELLRQGHQVTVLDCLTYAGPLENLAHLVSKQLTIVHHDFSQPLLHSLGGADYIVHNGAASHVLRSLEDPGIFVQSNVIGTLNMLEYARKVQPKKFIYISTDETFGPAGEKPWVENDTLRPTNPYSASKAGGEFLAYSYFRSFGVPVVITRTINMFGERQNSEKFVPLVVQRLMRGEVVDIHAKKGEVGSRFWLYAGEQACAMTYLAKHGIPGQAYHVASSVKKTNLEMAELIAKILDVELHYRFVQYAWSGHDMHYDIRESPEGKHWKVKESFEDLLRKTVLWHRNNQ